jgi:lysophospholipase L1-like esterase
MKFRSRNDSRLSALLVCFTLSALGLRAANPAPLAGQRVLWLGDSITQAGDYVTFTEEGLERQFPQQSFDVVSIGRSSETLSGLSEKTHPGPRPCVFDRLPRALELVKPAVVIACYGMNDGIYHPPSAERLQAFQDGVRRLIRLCRAAGAKVVLLTPPPFDRVPVKNLVQKDAPDFSFRIPYENYDEVLGEFARWELTLPAEEAQVIDLHGPMNEYLAVQRRNNPEFSFVRDGIHPNAAGHLLMAQLVLRGLGAPAPDAAAALDAELARIQADPVYALIKRRREMRSGAWLNYVGLPGTIQKTEEDAAKLQSQIDQLRAAPAEKVAP